MDMASVTNSLKKSKQHALMVINKEKEKKVIIPEEASQDDGSCCVGLMVADNIDNLECTLAGSGTSHLSLYTGAEKS